MATQSPSQKPFTIAVVGGGIGGLALAIALRRQNVPVQVYESAPAFAEIGAGIAFGPNAIRSMELIDPAIRTAFTSRATKNGAKEDEETWINFRCGVGEPDLIAKVQTSDEDKTGLSSVHRAHFMDELAALIPKNIGHFGKRLMGLEQLDSGKIQLAFEDGTTAHADAVVGCDGVRSRVRQILLDKKSPLEDLMFSGKYAYRGLIPMGMAKEALGDYLAGNSQMYLGPEGHILTYPIDHGRVMNVIAFKNQYTPWEHENWVLKGKGDEFKRDFEGWGKPVQSILELVDSPDMWALFDHRPASTYCKGRIAILGDAAHASTPHQGAGAGQAMEDALILGRLLGDKKTQSASDIPAAFEAYDAVRRPRSQKVVTTSRAAGLTYAFQGAAGCNVESIREELLQRYQWIWEEDMEKQAEQAKLILSGEKRAGMGLALGRVSLWKKVIEDVGSRMLAFCQELRWWRRRSS
ncbi:putative salicylate hydroxylase [Bisporella sp. PMI_857]|nr:putative salicylate hydroxylase [Bisporella sp. PMI_857]